MSFLIPLFFCALREKFGSRFKSPSSAGRIGDISAAARAGNRLGKQSGFKMGEWKSILKEENLQEDG